MEIAKLLELPEYFVVTIGEIWQIIRSKVNIDPEAFGKFCKDFVEKFRNDPLISWYQWNPTLHKGTNQLLL